MLGMVIYFGNQVGGIIGKKKKLKGFYRQFERKPAPKVFSERDEQAISSRKEKSERLSTKMANGGLLFANGIGDFWEIIDRFSFYFGSPSFGGALNIRHCRETYGSKQCDKFSTGG